VQFSSPNVPAGPAGGGNGGGDNDKPGGDNGSGNGGDESGGDVSGVAGAEAGGGGGAEGGTAPGGGQGGGEPCAKFEQASALTGSGALPFWALGVAAVGAFGLGRLFSRRRGKEVDPTG
jgi:hypothetical protein